MVPLRDITVHTVLLSSPTLQGNEKQLFLTQKLEKDKIENSKEQMTMFLRQVVRGGRIRKRENVDGLKETQEIYQPKAT